MGARKWVIGGFLAATLIIVGLGVSAYRAQEKRERAAVDSALADALARAESIGVPVYAEHLRKNPIADEENAWIELSEIHEAIYYSRRDGPGLNDLMSTKGKTEFLAIADQAFDFWRPLMVLAEAAANKPKYLPERKWESGVGLIMPDLATSKALVRALTLQSRLDLYEGELDAAISRLQTAAKIAQYIGTEPIVIPVLVQIAIESDIAKETVFQAGLDGPQEYDDALKEILDGLFEPRGVKDRIIAETVIFVESVRMASSENEAGNELRESIKPEDRPKILTYWDTSAAEALRFEVMAINESCDYFEAMIDDVAAYEQNDRALYGLTSLPFEWILDGFPMSYAKLYEQLGGGTDMFDSGGPFWRLARGSLLGEMYQLAFEIVTGGRSMEDGDSFSSVTLPGHMIFYTETDEGFELNSGETDRRPARVRIPWG